MMYPVSTGSSTISDVSGHGILHQYSQAPGLSSNLHLKKHFPTLEILSEASATADEITDAASWTEGTEYSLCTSPTSTKESSSDEGAKLLVQQFNSSENPLMYGNEAKRKRHGTLQGQQTHNLVTKNVERPSKIKVSFQGGTATEISSTRLHKQLQFSTTEAGPSTSTPKESFFKAQSAPEIGITDHRKPKLEAYLEPSKCALKLHLPAAVSHRCFPSVSKGAAELLRRSTNSLFKLRNFISEQWQKSSSGSEDDGDLILGQLPDTNMNDVNEMKALLNTINQNLKMLENRSRAHPQLLSSKLAPVYFTT